jgi:hypothetical protein
MSTDERMAAIGKLVTERTQARQAAVLLGQQIRDAGKALDEVGAIIMREHMPQLGVALIKLNELINAGNLQQLREKILDYQVLEGRIGDLSKSLKDSGAE